MSEPEATDVPPGVSGPPGPLLRLLKDKRIAFLAVGAINTVVGAMWFVVFDYLLGHRFGFYGHYIALTVTYVAAILCAFVLYRKLVFRVSGHVLRDLLRFSSVYATTYVLNLVMITVFVKWLGMNAVLAQFLFLFVSTTLSWFGHRHYSFRREPAAHAEKE